MKLLKFRFMPLLLFIFGACSGNGLNHTATDNDLYLPEIKRLADCYLEKYASFFPEQGAYVYPKKIDFSRFTDNSLFGQNAWQFVEDSIYVELKQLPGQYQIGNESWYIYGILREILESSIELRICKPALMSINHINGWQVTMPEIAANQPVGTDNARTDAIKRWSSFGKYIDNEITNLRKGIKFGYTMQKDIVLIVIDQLETMLKEPIEGSAYYSPAKRDEDELFKLKWKELVTSQIYPSIAKYLLFLKNEYYPVARAEISVLNLPNGSKCFEAYFRTFTSLRMSVQEIYDVSEYRVKVNDSKLRLVGKKAYNTDSIPLIINKIQTDTAEYFKDREQLIAFIHTTIKKAEKECAKYFYHLPKSRVEARAIPENDNIHPGSYYIPSLPDLDMPPVLYMSAKNPEKRLKGNVETEIFHESYPGHHLQIGLMEENKKSHPISKLFSSSGFVEGWASYAQILAEEMDLYSSSYSRLLVLGRSSRIMYIEACLNIKKWTREQAFEYLKNKGGFNTPETANQIINRAIVWPGQYSTYDTGLMELLELREQAMITLGDKFDIREFHNILLEDGSIPLEMLREKVNWWIENKKVD